MTNLVHASPEPPPRSSSTWLGIAGGAVVGGFVVWAALVGSSADASGWAAFGDAMGPAAGFASVIAVLAALYSISMQREELALQRQELADTRAELAGQREAAEEHASATKQHVEATLALAKSAAMHAKAQHASNVMNHNATTRKLNAELEQACTEFITAARKMAPLEHLKREPSRLPSMRKSCSSPPPYRSRPVSE